MENADARRVTRSLSAALDTVSFTNQHPDAVATLLTEAVVAWAHQQGWQVHRHVPGRVRLPGHRHPTEGLLDLVCRRPHQPPVAIAVDPGNTPRAVLTLLAEAQNGALPLWLSWGHGPAPTAPAPVTALRLPVLSRPTPDGGRLHSRPAPPPPAAPRPRPRTPRRMPRPAPAPDSGCRATTRQGKPCPIPARTGQLCHVHDPATHCAAPTANGRRCATATGGRRCSRHHHIPREADRAGSGRWTDRRH